MNVWCGERLLFQVCTHDNTQIYIAQAGGYTRMEYYFWFGGLFS